MVEKRLASMSLSFVFVIGRCSKNDTHMRSVHVQRHDTAYRRLFFEVQKCVTCLIFEQVMSPTQLL